MNPSLRVRVQAHSVTPISPAQPRSSQASVSRSRRSSKSGGVYPDSLVSPPLSRLSSGSCVVVSACSEKNVGMSPLMKLGAVGAILAETADNAAHLASGASQASSLQGLAHVRGLHEPLFRAPIFRLFTDMTARRDAACDVLRRWSLDEIQAVERQVARVQVAKCPAASRVVETDAYLSGALSGMVTAAMAMLGHDRGVRICDRAIDLIDGSMKSHERSLMVMVALSLAVCPDQPPMVSAAALKLRVLEQLRVCPSSKKKKARRAPSWHVAALIGRALTLGQSSTLSTVAPQAFAAQGHSDGGSTANLSGNFEHLTLADAERHQVPDAEKRSFVASWISSLMPNKAG